MTESLALIVDDEPHIRELIAMTLTPMGLETKPAANVAEARSLLEHHDFSLCFTDMRLPDGTGLELVHHVGERYPQLPIAVITAYGNQEDAVEALKAGAFDFVSKPVDIGVLRDLVRTALKVERKPSARAPAAAPAGQTDLLGNSEEIRRLRTRIVKLAISQAPVLLTGEAGTGKEICARMIHEQGPRNDGPFVVANCGAIPAEQMESEFFGHRKGAVPGANGDKDGLFKMASGGTLFLDDVPDLPLHIQVKLLRALQDKTIRPVGAGSDQRIDVRVISATHRDLQDAIAKGALRQDLYYRIAVIELAMPSLRDRRDDIKALAEHFLAEIATEWGAEPATLDAAALRALRNHDFPGNVRELRNVLERAATLCEDGSIGVDDLDLESAPLQLPDEAPERGDVPLEEYIEGIEREVIQKALEETRYNKTKAAEKLGITFRALRYRLKKLGMD